MKINFAPRIYKKGLERIKVELHIRMSAGRGIVQRTKTKILVDPALWDKKGQCINPRTILCPEDEKIRIKKEVSVLSNYIYDAYVSIDNSCTSIPPKG